MNGSWKGITAAFLCGIIVGGAVVGRRMGCYFGRGHGPEKSYTRILKRLNAKLHFTPEQKSQVERVLDEGRKKMGALHADIRPKFDQMRTETNAAIRALLNPDQRIKFDQMQAEWETRRQNRNEAWDKR